MKEYHRTTKIGKYYKTNLLQQSLFEIADLAPGVAELLLFVEQLALQLLDLDENVLVGLAGHAVAVVAASARLRRQRGRGARQRAIALLVLLLILVVDFGHRLELEPLLVKLLLASFVRQLFELALLFLRKKL